MCCSWHSQSRSDGQIESKQTANETTAYFVLEHAPKKCAALPADGACTFTDIYLEVDGKQVLAPAWQPVIGKAAKCSSKTTITDPKTIKISWDATDAGGAVGEGPRGPAKWAAGAAGNN